MTLTDYDPNHSLDPRTNLLHPSHTPFPHPPSKLSTLVLHTLSLLGLTQLTLHPKSGMIMEATNLTILNALLVRLGPMREERLVRVVVAVQVSVRWDGVGWDWKLIGLFGLGGGERGGVCD